jgi:drug/metabolite transporter (DMT)-like permease
MGAPTFGCEHLAMASASAAPTYRPATGWQVWTGLWIVYIVWGSTYLAIRVVVETMPPLLSGGVRFMLAGAILYTVLLVRNGRARVRFTREQLLSAGIVGTLLVTGGNGLVMVGELDVPSALAALIIASVPLWVVVYRRVAGEAIATGTLVGVGVGFVGLALILLPSGSNDEVTSWVGLLLLCLAAPSWALGSFLSKRRVLPSDPFLSTSLQMMLGGLTSVLAGLVRGEAGDVHFGAFSGDSLLAYVYLILIGSLVAFTAYVWLLQNAPVSKVATYAYVNPVIAIFLGWAILSEDITVWIVAGAAIVVASVATIVRKESA